MMKGTCTSCSKTMCTCSWIAWVLVIIGGLNWALVGIGIFTSNNLNVVNLIFGKVMWLEALVYLLVGLAALSLLFGCRCKKCCTGKGGMKKDGMGMSGGM